ncbi:hypothetical protein EVG20_g5310 [Dentipellis fragilis]|uniref:Metallo-beta-lactamase domain-containing protein n=1 Tax=Dentipellis fragilis TaxID=205917 RepID=A0A4Y9YVN2_9AGAM|nr:hypothetical protein EVG20_g5310 [Dentipellis fragilis]
MKHHHRSATSSPHPSVPEIGVVEPQRRFSSGYVNGVRPPHHLNNSQTKFCNPWPSFRFQALSLWVDFTARNIFSHTVPPDNVKSLIPIQTPTWGVGSGNESKAKATWLGHACYLVEYPTPAGASRGPRIIFDPVLSEHCAPIPVSGLKRFTDAPCSMDELPPVDLIVLSHNHYDHTDLPTLRSITSNPATSPHVFVALNNGAHISKALEIPRARVHELDWWDERAVRIMLPAAGSNTNTNTSDATESASASRTEKEVEAQLRVTCTPSQHVSGRGPFDRWGTLWAAWAIEELLPPAASSDSGASQPPSQSQSTQTSSGTSFAASSVWSTVGKKLFFAGDTGYRTVHNGEDEDKVPVCPAFAEVGERFGGMDAALLPIGAYGPRAMWSNLHASPSDAIRIMNDVKAKKGLAMHWGTWVLTTEPVMEPPALLRKECLKAGVNDDEFLVPGLGETVFF